MNPLIGDRKTLLILVGPALLVYTAFTLIPIVWSFGYIFTDGNAITGFTFTGIDNFVELFRDAKVRDALFFSLKYGVVMTIGQVTLGFLLSLAYVFLLRRSSSFVRTLVFFPVVLPTVAVALLFQQLFAIAPADGLVNSFVHLLGGDSIDWLGNSTSAFLVLLTMDLWRSMGFYGVLLYAGILDIPEEIIESARIDGSGGLRLVRHIVLPLSMPVLLSALVLSINGTLKVFDSVIALTNGGPGNTTTPLTVYMFQTSFQYGDYGYGSALAFLLTLICLAATIFIVRANRPDMKKVR
ncbi:carbohydrate ABC transporter permease [Agromyces albus]|uniref:carbohydrate ABC transporter permease n=1 Tax=Agromyces albus TaxID=205332 RepID=UPI00278A071A|nr:sugar ABC transporter permease [Agromyces albus]MDQ0577224.1 raffinose/stachyose/melibiose transport system permease protein [Agromyces albus]